MTPLEECVKKIMDATSKAEADCHRIRVQHFIVTGQAVVQYMATSSTSATIAAKHVEKALAERGIRVPVLTIQAAATFVQKTDESQRNKMLDSNPTVSDLRHIALDNKRLKRVLAGESIIRGISWHGNAKAKKVGSYRSIGAEAAGHVSSLGSYLDINQKPTEELVVRVVASWARKAYSRIKEFDETAQLVSWINEGLHQGGNPSRGDIQVRRG